MDIDYRVGEFSRRELFNRAFVNTGGLMALALSSKVAIGQTGRSGNVAAHAIAFANDIGFYKDVTVRAFKKKLPEALAEGLTNTNRKLASRGFADSSSSDVFAGGNLFFYVMKHQDRFNAAAAFFDRNLKDVTAIVDGPALIALAAAASYLRNENGITRDDCCQLLFPKQTKAAISSSFRKSYPHTALYKTQNGTVKIDYRTTKFKDTTKTGEGVISVTVADMSRGREHPVFDKDIHISYTASQDQNAPVSDEEL